MPVLSPKRQVTLPKELCDRLHVEPGDDLAFLEHQGRITIVKKATGRSAGVLKHLTGTGGGSDEQSMLDAVAAHRTAPQRRRRSQ